MHKKRQPTFSNNSRRRPTSMKSLPENKTHSPSDQARFLGKKEPNSSHRTRQAEHWHVALSLLTTRLQTTESSFHTSNSGAVPKLCASGAIGIKPAHHVVSGAAQEEPALTKRTYAARVRFGSLAAAPSDNGRGRFTPESGHERSARVRQGLRQMIISHPSIYFWDVGLVES
jgi:hypothetical protein